MSHSGADCKAIAVVMLPDLYAGEPCRNGEPIEMVGLFVQEPQRNYKGKTVCKSGTGDGYRSKHYCPFLRAVTTGRRNTSWKPTCRGLDSLRSFVSVDSSETPTCVVLIEYSRTDRFKRKSQETELAVGSVPTLFCLGIQPHRLNGHARSTSGLPQEVVASFRHTKR